MKKVFQENLIKNILVFILLIPAYTYSRTFLFSLPAISDKSVLGSLLAAVSILAMIACTGNFAFTYEKINIKNYGLRLLAHTITGTLMLFIGLSLEMTSLLVELLVGKFFIFDLSLVVLYIASILYDFWDMNRTNFSS